jgi:hypothetical protein
VGPDASTQTARTTSAQLPANGTTSCATTDHVVGEEGALDAMATPGGVSHEFPDW